MGCAYRRRASQDRRRTSWAVGGEERTSRLMWFSNDGGETEILDGDGGGEAEKPRRQYRGIRNFTRLDVVVLLGILFFLVFLLGVFQTYEESIYGVIMGRDVGRLSIIVLNIAQYTDLLSSLPAAPRRNPGPCSPPSRRSSLH